MSLFPPETEMVVPGQVPAIILRPYQEKARAAIHAARERGCNRILVVMPTGTGKTSLFATLVGDFDAMGCHSMILAHREELLHQASARISLQNPLLPVGVEGGEYRCFGRERCVVASVASIGRESTNRLRGFKPGFLTIDEAHHAPAASYQIVMNRYGGYDGKCFVLGVTATPHRMDNRPLHGDHHQAIFQECAFVYSLREAIDDGWLCDIRGYKVNSNVDLSGVKTTAGDYNQGELQRKVNTEERNRDAFRHWQKVARDRRTIVFCAGVDHAHEVAKLFRAQGITAEAIDGETPKDQRRDILKRFRSGETQVLTNMDIATEGFDAPEIGCVLMLRPTQSWALFTQCVGRGLRPASGKTDCIVIDVVDNTSRHSIASVPALLGLPPGLDLQGNSLHAAAKLVDEMSDFHKGALFNRQCSFADLQSKLSEVDLLAGIEVPEDLRGVVELSWFRTGDGAYQLGCGKGRDDKRRSAAISTDPLGNFQLSFICEKEVYREVTLQPSNDKDAFREAEAMIKREFPGIIALAGNQNAWRGKPPSDAQKDLLHRLGVSWDAIQRLNKGQATQIISAKLATRGKR